MCISFLEMAGKKFNFLYCLENGGGMLEIFKVQKQARDQETTTVCPW